MKNRIAIGLMMFVSLHAANAQTSFGRTAGLFGVSEIGSAQYTIPVRTPPGLLREPLDARSDDGITT